MIIMDFNQVAIANLMGAAAGFGANNLDENLLRHMILNSIRLNKLKFEGQFGEMVIACDATANWRKDLFPFYKANRKKSRSESTVDWNEMFRILNMIREELVEFFPYPTIRVDHAEADDVIAALCAEHGRMLGGDPILILSGDKDFQQLQKYSNVTQYDPVRKRWLKCADPEAFLQEHILRGDSGDGVPNVLSEDDTFVSGGRQKPVTKKKLTALMENIPQEYLANYDRNRKMIDLAYIPEQVHATTLQLMQEQSGKGRSKLFNYFIKNKLKNLTDCIGEF